MSMPLRDLQKPGPTSCTSMIAAKLYLEEIDLRKYLPGTDCQECGVPSCAAFVRDLKDGTRSPGDCPSLSRTRVRAFQFVLAAGDILPEVPALDLPRPAITGAVEINNPREQAPILVSGNSQFTQEILTTVMGHTRSPFWVLFVDCRGDTVDMAMIYRSLTATKISQALNQKPLKRKAHRGEIILPGLAHRLREPLQKQTGRSVRAGPICFVELPLFLGEQWEMA